MNMVIQSIPFLSGCSPPFRGQAGHRINEVPRHGDAVAAN